MSLYLQLLQISYWEFFNVFSLAQIEKLYGHYVNVEHMTGKSHRIIMWKNKFL